MKRVAIVGGGVAGLAAAYELARLVHDGAPLQVVLFEASPRLGGIVETVREGGFVIECGPDAWVTEKPWARELAEELGLGDEVLNKVGAPLLSGVFGGDVSKLSVRAVMAPFVAMEREHGSLITALQARVAIAKTIPVFTTLRSGMGTLVDCMIAAVPEEWVRLAAEVRFVSYGDEGWLVGTARGVERFDAVMMAAPVDAAGALLGPVDERAAQLMEMDASSAVVVGFGFPDASKFELPSGFGFLIPPGSDNLLLACTFVDQKFDDRVPRGGRLVRAFFGGKAADRLMRCGNDETAAVARLELARILGPLPEPQMTVVRRWPRSLPQYAVGHLERMTELAERVKKLDGLWLLGNGYRGVGLPDLIRDARAAARQFVERV